MTNNNDIEDKGMDNQNALIHLKELMKGEYEYYCLAFKEKDENSIMSIMSKYTTNFLLLKTLDINNLDNIIICYCDINNCDDKLKNIFNHDFKDITKLNYLDEYIEYILFPLIIKISGKLTNSENAENYLFNKMIDLIKNNFKYYKICICNNNAFLKFIANDIYLSKSSDEIFIAIVEGIGDAFMDFSLKHEFLIREKKNKKNIYQVITKRNYKRNYRKIIMSNIAHDISVILFSNSSMIHHWIMLNEEEIITENESFYNIVHKSAHMHLYDTRKISYKLTGNEYDNPYKYNNVLSERILNTVSENEIKIVDELLENKNFIGFQCFSGMYSIDAVKWESDDWTRNWNEENAENFLKLCYENNLNIIVLTPNPYYSLKRYVHLPTLSISGYVYAISKLKFVVGIDSSAGHIAAFYNISSITIWGESTPFNALGFRALRNNISIVPKSKDINNVSYKTVYNILLHTITYGIIDCERIISYEDSLNSFNIIYVD